MRIENVLQSLNRTHQTTFRLGQRYAIGEQGAYALIDAQGQAYVLKWQPRANHLQQAPYAQTVTEHLRAQGYPAPAYLHIGSALGGVYTIQQALPGAPMGHVTLQRLPDVLKLQAMHASPAPPGLRDWPREVAQTVLQGGEGYCLHASLRQHSPETAEMLQTLQALVAAYQGAIEETNEIVHFDFQPANLLIHDNAVSGVVDWDGVRAGDSAFDLATVLFYGYDDSQVRDALWAQALARRPIQVLSVYLAHLILRQVDWSLRHYGPAVYKSHIARGQALLADIKARL